MKRIGYTEAIGNKGLQTRITRQHRAVNPIEVGVICADRHNTKLWLTVYNDGRWELCSRPANSQGAADLITEGQLET